MRRKTGILPELRESERHKPPHLTCGQTSGTSSQRFWLLCSPAESYRLHTTTSCPAARLSLWQPPQTQQALDGITLTPTEPPKSQVCFHTSASVEPKKKIWLLLISSRYCPRALVSLCPPLCVYVTATKRITVAARSCLAGINRGTWKQQQEGTDVFSWSFLLF